MTRCLILLAFMSGACARPLPASPTPAAAPAVGAHELAQVGLVLRELSPNVILAVHTGPKASSANVLAVRMEDGTVVICSSPYDTETTRVLVRALREVLGSGTPPMRTWCVGLTRSMPPRAFNLGRHPLMAADNGARVCARVPIRLTGVAIFGIENRC